MLPVCCFLHTMRAPACLAAVHLAHVQCQEVTLPEMEEERNRHKPLPCDDLFFPPFSYITHTSVIPSYSAALVRCQEVTSQDGRGEPGGRADTSPCSVIVLFFPPFSTQGTY